MLCTDSVGPFFMSVSDFPKSVTGFSMSVTGKTMSDVVFTDGISSFFECRRRAFEGFRNKFCIQRETYRGRKNPYRCTLK